MLGGQLDTSNDSHAKYDWGGCSISSSSGSYYSCSFNKLGTLMFVQQYSTKGNSAVFQQGKTLCGINGKNIDADSLAGKICQQETNHKKPDESGDNFKAWYYQ